MERLPETDQQVIERANDAVARRIGMDQTLRSGATTSEGKESIDIRFENLSQENLEDASELVNRVFTPRLRVAGKDLARAFSESVKGFEKRDGQIEYNQRYWVARNPEGKIVGVTGFTQAADDSPDHAWLGWFCIDPDLRGSGTGEKLLNHTANESRSAGIKDLYSPLTAAQWSETKNSIINRTAQ